jgi:hypothetical protein
MDSEPARSTWFDGDVFTATVAQMSDAVEAARSLLGFDARHHLRPCEFVGTTPAGPAAKPSGRRDVVPSNLHTNGTQRVATR